MIILLSLIVAVWTWLGTGPRLLRWPSLLGLVLLTSGHPLGQALVANTEVLAAPLLTLLIMGFGIKLMLGGGAAARRRDSYARYLEERRYRDRW
jgi:hypothetical protein